MSILLKSLAAFIKNNPNPELHVVSGQEWREDEEASLSQAVPLRMDAEIVEPSGKIDGVAVGEPEHGRLAFFLDGVERRHVPFFISMVPVLYGYAAAVIRARGVDRRMATYDRARISEALYAPGRLVDLNPLKKAGLEVYDIFGPDEELQEHPMMLLDKARKKVSGVRDDLEKKAASDWLADFNGRGEWLMVDGSLSGNYDSFENPNIIGVVKSHQTQYFPMESQRKILNLRAGERSGIFIPKGRKRPEVYSWYLRLRPNEGRDVYFGLVRVEAARRDRTIEMADEISRWLLAERCPLSLPDSRWDRMLYPIRDCEQYLRSLAPTRTVIEASMVGL